jgi:hypothetical protein
MEQSVAWLMPNMLVLRGRSTRLIETESRFRLSVPALNEARDVYLSAIEHSASPANLRSVFAKHAAVQIALLTLRHGCVSDSIKESIRRLASDVRSGRKKVDQTIQTFNEADYAAARWVDWAEQDFWTIDPLSITNEKLKVRCDNAMTRIEQAKEGIKRATKATPADVTNAQVQQDLLSIRPFDANPNLKFFLLPIKTTLDPLPVVVSAEPVTEPVTPSNFGADAFTIVFFPPDGAKEVTEKVVAIGAKSSPEKLRGAKTEPTDELAGKLIPRLIYCLEVSHSGSWRAGDTWQARFFLFEESDLREPIINTREPVIEVIERQTGWFGVRPTSVKVTEEQLASRFFVLLKQIAEGAGVSPAPIPDDSVLEQYASFVERALVVALGGDEPRKNAQNKEQGYARPKFDERLDCLAETV